ncbi:MAG: SUMF1/EgtB/PvdO family nonheme iron enzyme, partial [Fuerstiella sp.]
KQSPAKDPTGPTSGSFRVLRGGSWWLYDARGTRSAYRGRFDADLRNYIFGFRLVRELD